MKIQAHHAEQASHVEPAHDHLHDAVEHLQDAAKTADHLGDSIAAWAKHAHDPAAQRLASSLEHLSQSIGKLAGIVRKFEGVGAAKAPKPAGKVPKAQAPRTTKPRAAGAATKTHTVKKGDTMWDIARNAGVPLDRLVAANPQVANPDLIFPGEKIRIPRGGSVSGVQGGGATSGANGGGHAPVSQGGGHAPVGQGGDVGPISGAGVGEISAHGREQMRNLLRNAIANSGGKRPQGWCLREVQDILDRTSYGKIGHGGTPRFNYAHDFADYLNAGGRWSHLGLKRLNIHNPYDAPPGAIVVVRAGTPGTHHPTAGDIAIAAGHGRFLNDGEMGYGGPGNFPRGNNYVLGVYVPA